jgi:hypothetical protein
LTVVKTLRSDPEREKLQRPASVAGVSLSEFIRQAAAERADAVLRTNPREDVADVLGIIHGRGNQARHTGQAFSDLLAARQAHYLAGLHLNGRNRFKIIPS